MRFFDCSPGSAKGDHRDVVSGCYRHGDRQSPRQFREYPAFVFKHDSRHKSQAKAPDASSSQPSLSCVLSALGSLSDAELQIVIEHAGSLQKDRGNRVSTCSVGSAPSLALPDPSMLFPYSFSPFLDTNQLQTKSLLTHYVGTKDNFIPCSPMAYPIGALSARLLSHSTGPPATQPNEGIWFRTDCFHNRLVSMVNFFDRRDLLPEAAACYKRF